MVEREGLFLSSTLNPAQRRVKVIKSRESCVKIQPFQRGEHNKGGGEEWDVYRGW